MKKSLLIPLGLITPSNNHHILSEAREKKKRGWKIDKNELVCRDSLVQAKWLFILLFSPSPIPSGDAFSLTPANRPVVPKEKNR